MTMAGLEPFSVSIIIVKHIGPGFELGMVQRAQLVQKNQKLQYTFFKKVNNFIWIAGIWVHFLDNYTP